MVRRTRTSKGCEPAHHAAQPAADAAVGGDEDIAIGSGEGQSGAREAVLPPLEEGDIELGRCHAAGGERGHHRRGMLVLLGGEYDGADRQLLTSSSSKTASRSASTVSLVAVIVVFPRSLPAGAGSAS
jgi:hypothetical protein